MTAQRKIEWWVGLFVLAALGAGGAFLSVRLVEEHWIDRHWRIDLDTAHGYGLTAGNPVKLNGVAVGTVDAVEIDRDTGSVRIRLGIKRRYRKLLTETARFVLRQPAVFGDSWVEIQSDGKPGTPLKEGAVRSIEVPQEALAGLGVTKERVTSMLDSVQTLLGNLATITSDMREGRGNLGRVLNDTALYDQFSQVLTQSNSILADARDPGTSVGRLLSENTLHDNLVKLTGELEEAVRSIRKEEDQAKQALKNLNEVLSAATEATVQVRDIARKVNEGKGTVGKFANDEAVYDETRRILSQLRETLEDLREQTPISTFMGALFGAF